MEPHKVGPAGPAPYGKGQLGFAVVIASTAPRGAVSFTARRGVTAFTGFTVRPSRYRGYRGYRGYRPLAYT